ncbi:uncharacterized protein LOC124646914 [Lolium rigidum]|uniref:uncharacterized protein LOC124646914 n=1 Tax=Lolium rigidum TaxID=89674 RepID=UPI001F5D7FC2|nr:uncharacterized protein LOC124646914 [Lolium rigidum]
MGARAAAMATGLDAGEGRKNRQNRVDGRRCDLWFPASPSNRPLSHRSPATTSIGSGTLNGPDSRGDHLLRRPVPHRHLRPLLLPPLKLGIWNWYLSAEKSRSACASSRIPAGWQRSSRRSPASYSASPRPARPSLHHLPRSAASSWPKCCWKVRVYYEGGVMSLWDRLYGSGGLPPSTKATPLPDILIYAAASRLVRPLCSLSLEVPGLHGCTGTQRRPRPLVLRLGYFNGVLWVAGVVALRQHTPVRILSY